MEATILKVEPRTAQGKKLVELRENKLVPGVIYGNGFEPKMISVERPVMAKLLATGGESRLIDLMVSGDKQPVKALVQDVQHDPISDLIVHVDFHAVRMDQKLKVEVPLNFIGEAIAVKGLGGTLVKAAEHVLVACLPDALVQHLDVDISSLNTFEDKIRVSDLKVPAGLEILTPSNETLALVAAPRSDEELAALDQAVELDATKVEVVEKKKKEEEGEEGAATEAGAPAAEAKPEAKKENNKK